MTFLCDNCQVGEKNECCYIATGVGGYKHATTSTVRGQWAERMHTTNVSYRGLTYSM